ncbi:CrcB family protein [Nocardioides sp. SR21]|uniref:fluoride efflux transporter FluC n=1 Tax=Nocardioides sp. SR21 TaxID=2919501 RepID=UPI001FAA5694|nr:CrcB family protein [Nocardioides sp. SR21]
MTALLVALGAAVGAPLRFVVATRLDGRLPWGTLAVNVAGSFLLGALSAMSLTSSELALLGVGFCGGFTTYSAFSVQTHGLGPRRGTAYAAATIVTSLAACAVGFHLAS